MIIWLASYPKSGNTLVRSMLSAYNFSNTGEFNFDLLSEDKNEWVLKRVSKKRSGYSKQVMKVNKKYNNPTLVEYYNRRGDLLKVAEFSDWKKFNVGNKEFFKAMKIHMKNKLTKKESIFSWRNRKLGEKVKKNKFNPARLR